MSKIIPYIGLDVHTDLRRLGSGETKALQEAPSGAASL